MSYNGSGTFVINTTGQPVVAGTVISSTAFNALTADLATGLSTAITKDGQTTTTTRIPFAAGINSSLTTDSSSTTTGSIITAGGVGVAKALYVGTTSNFAGAATFSSTITYGGVTLSAAVTGTGKMVLDTSPTLVTPVLGVATATSINKLTLTTPATSATLTVADGASLVTSGAYSLTLTATAATNVTFPTTGTLATLAGSETFTNKTLTNPTVTNYVETVVAIGTVTSSSTLSLTSGTVQTATLTASTACTFTMPTATAGKSFILLLKQAAATGNGTATFTDVKFGTSGAPTITATAGKMDILTFVADGTNWYGSAAQGYTP
jgi:hypothetical protein